ncbi:hypothetical protein [Acidisphaera sp. S103]|uniref:hypothetical protein n=1 Tax=Acidisphaera sp. S103 TaxID=1747223 RepID=UPI00131D23AB|nr:hypothetical protein [Acidisphaera sp. S103]
MRFDDQARDVAVACAEALEMLLNVATDERSKLPTLELYTNLALIRARAAVANAVAAGLLNGPDYR